MFKKEKKIDSFSRSEFKSKKKKSQVNKKEAYPFYLQKPVPKIYLYHNNCQAFNVSFHRTLLSFSYFSIRFRGLVVMIGENTKYYPEVSTLNRIQLIK